MVRNAYCPFCGVILHCDPYKLDPPSPRIRIRPWYAQVRGIYVTGGQISITGLGLVYNGYPNHLHAPLDSETSYVDVGLAALEKWTICALSSRRWCFSFHHSCWTLLLLRLGSRRDDGSLNERAIAESVFYQLYCTPFFERSSFEFGHDYLGAAQAQNKLEWPRRADLSSSFYADPCAIPSAHDLEMIAADSRKTRNDRLQRTPITSSRESREKPEGRKSHLFDVLSPELIFEVLSYLSFGELLAMRLTCRTLASLAEINAMPQSYWRSRFYLGQEADFLFPNLTDPRDWSLLFFGVTNSLRTGDLPLVNRKRIRRLLEPIAALVEVESVFRDGPHGLVVNPAQGQASSFQLISDESTQESPRLVNVARSFSGQVATTKPDQPLHEGCRVLHYRIQLSMPPRGQHRRRFSISMVQIGARSFISGINLPVSGECDASGRRLLGYHNPASEKWVEIPSTACIKALGVAFCSGGLTGIQFMFTNSDSSGWIGVSNGPGVAIGSLDIPEGRSQYYLLAGLDHLKIVSLGFGKLADHCGDSLEFPCAGIEEPPCVQSHLWTQQPPRHEDLTMSPFLPTRPFQAFEPLINVDFGGPRGVLLGSLTRLAFHIHPNPGPYPFTGIEASYSSGRCMLFGSRSGCVLSVFVNGPEGERISHISICEYSEEGDRSAIALGGLQVLHIVSKHSCTVLILTQVSTNFGRTATVAPLHIRLSKVAWEMLVPPPDHTITGFTAVKRDHYGGLVRVGIQSQPCGDQPPIPTILNHECHRAREDQLRYDVKFSYFISRNHPANFQTYASLKNVRRIQASTGIEGRSRSATCISGLKIEYHGHPSPGIVGQWMSPLDDSFELSPDEDIQSLTTWSTPRESGYRIFFDRIVAIHIETTRARSAMFRSPAFHSLSPANPRHQHRASPGETLTAISWIMNSLCERVRAVISADTAARCAQVPVPEPTAPFDQICKLDFERLPTPDSTTNANNNRDTLVTAEAYFSSHVIIGLVFTYTSGSKFSIGDHDLDLGLDTITRKAIHFAPHANTIVGLSTTVTESRLTELAFEVELDTPAQPRSKTLVLSNPLRDVDIAHERQHVWRQYNSDVFTQEDGQSSFSRDRSFARLGRTRLVGMYVGCQDFWRVGAVYQPEDALEGV